MMTSVSVKSTHLVALKIKLPCYVQAQALFSLVPPLAAFFFFAAVEENMAFFSTAAKKSCERRPGYEARLHSPAF